MTLEQEAAAFEIENLKNYDDMHKTKDPYLKARYPEYESDKDYKGWSAKLEQAIADYNTQKQRYLDEAAAYPKLYPGFATGEQFVEFIYGTNYKDFVDSLIVFYHEKGE